MLLLGPKPAHAGRQTNKQQGFTLLELLVVLVIIAVISSTSIGALRFFGEQTIKTFQKDVTSLLSLALEEAILTGKVHGLFRNNTQLVLRKFSRPEKKATPTQETKGVVGDVFSGLMELGKKSEAEGEDARASQANTSQDPGAFPVEAGGSWIDVDLPALDIPTGFELVLETDQPISLIDFNAEPEEKTQPTLSGLGGNEAKAETKNGKDKKKKKLRQEKLITTFWPNGLIQPGGTATIMGEEGDSQVSIRWLTTAEIEVTGNN